MPWHASRYNITAPLPDSDKTIVLNTLTGVCETVTPLELYLLNTADELSDDHPAIDLLSKKGLLVNCDELTLLEAKGTLENGTTSSLGLTICPTLGCNFDCPYCFEDHKAGKMTQEVQDQVVDLVERYLLMGTLTSINVSWFGGEPLLAPEIIESLSERMRALAREHDVEYSATITTNAYLLTQEIADMLGREQVISALIALDGLGATHDATRHLAGGGPTFERITKNLREIQLPFPVALRHNIQVANYAEREPLKKFAAQLAEESGNTILYYPAVVWENEATEGRGAQLGIVHDEKELSIRIEQDAPRFGRGMATFCTASKISGIGIDHLGNLYKCWEAVDKPKYSFGHVSDWDPERPFSSAKNPDLFGNYMVKASPFKDETCRECRWLPFCVGSCPHKSIYGKGRTCLPYKDEPEPFIYEVYRLTHASDTEA